MRRATTALWFLALAVIVLQAWALSSVYFRTWLDGDIVYPERFVRDALGGRLPMSGWTLSSAPYFFPDFFVLAILCLDGLAGPVTPFYPLLFYPALALACGAVLRRVTPAERGGWLAGALLVNGLLVCDTWTDHARGLWWLGGPGMHGGAVLLGLGSLALWCGPVAESLSRTRWTVATGLMAAGVASDTLLLTQFLVPLACGFILAGGVRQWLAARTRQLLIALALAVAAGVVCRIGVQLAGGWRYSGVFRYAPLPPIWMAAARAFGRDIAGGVAHDQGWMLAIAIVGAGLGAWCWRRGETVEQRQFDGFAGAVVISTVALPIFAGYWKSPQHARYLLPLFVVPALWGVAAVLRREWKGGAWFHALVAIALAVAGAKAAREVCPDFATWPRSGEVAALEAWARREGFQRGLADYWTAHYVNTVGESDLWLNQLKPSGAVHFWNNNAFHHFRRERDGMVPDYAFIVLRNLDEEQLAQLYGRGEREERVGSYRVWVYEGESRRRLNAVVLRAISERLDGRWGASRVFAE